MQSSSRVREVTTRSANGLSVALVTLGVMAADLASLIAMPAGGLLLTAPRLLLLGACGVVLVGLYMLQPNEGAILTLFGRYQGTVRDAGLRWSNPFYVKRRISLRARNLDAATLKVNDKRGNPVEIGAVVVWRVQDTAQAVFEIDSYENYVRLQAESAIRHVATQFAYDEGEDLAPGETTLRAGDAAAHALVAELQARFADAGVVVQEAKITHLSYAPEIAQVMLRRQQAQAIISARKQIVQGAVSMVEAALAELLERQVVELDDERKAAMVSNLLVVLCSDRETQPIVNAGTLYA